MTKQVIESLATLGEAKKNYLSASWWGSPCYFWYQKLLLSLLLLLLSNNVFTIMFECIYFTVAIIH